ncbi:hypothetical protein FDZ73_04900 [bacterium]|nr:MAG: hypothetical protein FDZ73_04900 [bacterium]
MSVMIQQKKVLLVFTILAVFLVSNTAFSFHHHTSDHPAPEQCHICYVSNHSTTTFPSGAGQTVHYTGHAVHEPAASVVSWPALPIFLELANNRAPPVRTPA